MHFGIQHLEIVCCKYQEGRVITGPNGENRPADVLANTLHVAKIATGEIEETYVDETKRPGGQKGGRARADALAPEKRRQIAEEAAEARRS